MCLTVPFIPQPYETIRMHFIIMQIIHSAYRIALSHSVLFFRLFCKWVFVVPTGYKWLNCLPFLKHTALNRWLIACSVVCNQSGNNGLLHVYKLLNTVTVSVEDKEKCKVPL